jgi:hypothetical protein
MNYKRIVLGGLAAGAIIAASDAVVHGLFLAGHSEAVMAQAGLTYASWAIPVFVLIGFVFGLALAWLYAAIRPRYGAGWESAVRAGAAVWVLGYFIPTLWFLALGLGMPSTALNAVVWVYGLAQVMVAALVAGRLYQEEAAPAPGHVPA